MLIEILRKCSFGGYGIYIWPCYILLLALISWQIFAALRRNLSMHAKIKNQWLGTDSDPQA